jgi:conjugative transfer signal peptidase TraF
VVEFALPAHRTFRTNKRTITLVLTLCGLALAALSLLPQSPALVWNLSPSIPPGLYRLERATPARGDIVAVQPQGALRNTLRDAGVLGEARLLLKPVIADEGATVCRAGPTVSVDGQSIAVAKAHRSDGSPLPSWNGCRRLAHDELLLISSHPASFDSRYFGPVSTADVIGVAHPLLLLPHHEDAS